MKITHQYFVYIVECSDGFYYTGISNDLDRRLGEHNQGVNPTCFTFKRRPVVLKYYDTFTEVAHAISREKQIKGWSRKKKKALIEGDFELLKVLSKQKSRHSVHPSTSSG